MSVGTTSDYPLLGVFAGAFIGPRGIPTVNTQLFIGLLQSGFNFVVIANTEEKANFTERFHIWSSQIEFIDVSITFKNDLLDFFFRKIILNSYLALKCDIRWYPKNYGGVDLPFCHGPSVVTVHDIIGYVLPMFQGGKISWMRSFIRKVSTSTIRSATKIVAISQFTKSELCRALNIDSKMVSVITNAVDWTKFSPLSSQDKEVSTVNLPRNYVFYAGAFNEYKNIKVTLDAFSRSKMFRQGWEYILIGPDSALKGNIKEQLREYLVSKKLGNQIHILDGVKDYTELAVYYRNARLSLCPSLYEGFGLTILESIASGTLVCASTIAPHQEILPADYPYFVDDAKSTSSWVTCLDKYLNNSVHEKKEILATITARAKEYSWSKKVEQYTKLFQEVDYGKKLRFSRRSALERDFDN